MAVIDTIIKVDVSLAAAGASAPSFSIPLIIGSTSTGWSDAVHAYTDPSGMLTDGFTTSSQEYKYAKKLYGQVRQPSQFFVGKRSAVVAQVDTIQVGSLTGVPGHVYQFGINGVTVSYTSQAGDSYTGIIAGLNAAYSAAFPGGVPATAVVSGSGSGTTLTLTDAAPGTGFSITSVDSELTHVAVTPSHGIADDLNAVIAENNSWYAVASTSTADNDILQLASSIESLKKIYIAASADSAIGDPSSTTDLLSVLKGKSYNRTALMYSPGSYNLGIEAAWMGNFLPLTPGAYNPAYMTLSGITADTLSDGSRLAIVGNPVAQLSGKNGNVYTTVMGLDITQFGQMVGGRFLDIQIGLDWLTANIQVAILNVIFQASQLGQKIPYTDNGSAALQQAVKTVIAQGVVNGLVDGKSAITVSAPLVSSIPATQRQGRLGPPISFECTVQGAINAATVNGTVLV